MPKGEAKETFNESRSEDIKKDVKEEQQVTVSTNIAKSLSLETSSPHQWQWWSRFVAVVIWMNLAIAIFDKSYPTLQGLYAKYFPSTLNYYEPLHYQGIQSIDNYFIAFFGADFLIRTFAASYGKEGLSWGDTMLRRWYDIFLLLPIWRWLRIIPALVRSHQSRLFDMGRILSQVTHEPAAYLADRVSIFLLVRIVNQASESVKSGAAARMLFQPKDYIQVSNIDKADAILDRLLKLSIYKVLPRVQPELETVLHHNLDNIFRQSSVYQGILNLPGVDTLPANFVEELSSYLSQLTYDALTAYYSDTEGQLLVDRLTQDFKDSLLKELQEESTRNELQDLVSDLLEEVKLNYIQQTTEYDPTETLEEADQLQQQFEKKAAQENSAGANQESAVHK
ncbi:MAG: hypothetical protein WBA57_10630 [Elainellaceae cyanobacterium]